MRNEVRLWRRSREQIGVAPALGTPLRRARASLIDSETSVRQQYGESASANGAEIPPEFRLHQKFPLISSLLALKCEPTKCDRL